MPVTLPLELALLIVEYAVARRLDEGRLEHRQRLKRIGNVCKAFSELVGGTLSPTRIVFSQKKRSSATKRLKKAEADGRLVEVLVVSGEYDDFSDVLWRYGKTIVAMRYVGVPDFSYGAGDFTAKDFPALRTLAFTIPSVGWERPRPVEPLTIEELVLTLPNFDLLKNLLHPATTPHLRRLAFSQMCLPWDRLHEVLATAELDQRLERCQLKAEGTKIVPNASLRQYGVTTPTLLVAESYQVLPGASRAGLQADFPFIQLQSLPSPLRRPKASRTSNQRHDVLDSLATVIADGAGRKAVFLPLDVHPSSGRTFEPELAASRDRLLATIEACGVEYVGWYRADQDTDASISEPFRRYLGRERFEGRM